MHWQLNAFAVVNTKLDFISIPNAFWKKKLFQFPDIDREIDVRADLLVRESNFSDDIVLSLFFTNRFFRLLSYHFSSFHTDWECMTGCYQSLCSFCNFFEYGNAILSWKSAVCEIRALVRYSLCKAYLRYCVSSRRTHWNAIYHLKSPEVKPRISFQ